jgi:hypothetical protein
MAGEADQTIHAVSDAAASDSKVASGAESDTAPASSSSNDATHMIAKKVVPTLYDYWKKSSVTDAIYYAVGRLLGGVISSTSRR